MVPGLGCFSTAEAGAAPLGDCLTLIPFQRPAAEGGTGGGAGGGAAGHMFRSRDGKLLPAPAGNTRGDEAGSAFSFDLIHGIPGRGKSVLMNSLSLAFCLNAQGDRLPYNATIDIGPSSEGLISLIRESLPPERRLEAGYFRLSLQKKHAINPFDIMYLLARHVLVRHWWFDHDMVDQAPEAYREWHKKRLENLKDTPKRLCYDEFHRTAQAPGVVEQITRDVRETRKLRIHIVLASQIHSDFSSDLVTLAARFWILGSGGKQSELDDMATVFDLTETTKAVLRRDLTGPGRDGAPVLVIAGSGDGRTEQLLINTLGPVELWALNTNPVDVALRNRLYARLPAAPARAALARRFPEGGAGAEIARRITIAEERGQLLGEADVLDQMVDEIVHNTNPVDEVVHPANRKEVEKNDST